jgi:hypothetical protein
LSYGWPRRQSSRAFEDHSVTQAEKSVAHGKTAAIVKTSSGIPAGLQLQSFGVPHSSFDERGGFAPGAAKIEAKFV